MSYGAFETNRPTSPRPAGVRGLVGVDHHVREVGRGEEDPQGGQGREPIAEVVLPLASGALPGWGVPNSRYLVSIQRKWNHTNSHATRGRGVAVGRTVGGQSPQYGINGIDALSHYSNRVSFPTAGFCPAAYLNNLLLVSRGAILCLANTNLVLVPTCAQR